ncbi:hypothetical protein GCK72_011245 [Caenorhabditis remanei]|uniref:Uncharacterized protein n=1 Tax=Caenorhabditis remanei TaxID=31234 RepID=A0A6A5H570_CAERE|nr:hypothetical protein GCK72_011245 [Caenorhabditis remanei]KAF1762980.1 hypothetical protein GCK72_011245 [Caenorhabditis remanei]
MLRSTTLLLCALAVLCASTHGIDDMDHLVEEVEKELDDTMLQKVLSGSGSSRGAANGAATRHCGRRMVAFVRSICGVECQHLSPSDIADQCCRHSCSPEFIRNECCPNF